MRILIDLTSLADNFSGIERYAACLANEMVKNKENEYILVFKNMIHQMFAKSTQERNVEVVIIPGCNKLLFNQIRLPWELYKYKADWYLFLAFPVPILLFKKNIVSTIHDICCWDCPETMNGMSKWYFRLSHRIAVVKCRKIVTISKFSENRIVTKLKCPREKIWLIYCGVDKKFLEYQSNAEDNLRVGEKYNLPKEYLLSLSTLEPRKNLGLLINAYKQLVMKQGFDVPLVLAGRKGWKMDEILDGVDESVKKQIIFTGFIDDADLPVVYGNAKLFIFSSMYEGFGMPPLEAIACGTSVLSSDASSLPEVLGEVALYFKNGNRESLIEKLENYQKNRMTESQKVEQVKKFSWSNEAIKMLNLLTQDEIN